MNYLKSITISRLSVLEFGQFNKSTLANIALLGAGVVTDPVLIAYLAGLNTQSAAYDLAMINIAKSDETIKITNADELRDKAVTTLLRQLSVFEYSEDSLVLESYTSLNNLMNVYKGIQKWNYEEETNGIDNLLVELQSPNFSGHIATLGMGALVTNLTSKNSDFKSVFNTRMLETANKVSYDVKAMRKTFLTDYQTVANYVLAMSNVPTALAQHTSVLNVMNAVRTYYHDLLAHRTPNNQTAIPPMPA